MARILILTPQLPIPPQALTGTSQGTTIRNYHLIAGLARRHTVDLVSFSDREQPLGQPSWDREDSPLMVDALQRSMGWLHQCCEQIITAPQPIRSTAQRIHDTVLTKLPDMALRLESPDMHRQITQLLSKHPNDYDVIQIEGIEMAPYALALPATVNTARLNSGVPRLVFDDHNAEYVLQRRAFLTDVRRPRRWIAAAYSFVQWRKLVAYERRVCRAADRIVAVSDVDRDALLRLAPGHEITVVPNGVDLDFLRPGVVLPHPELKQPALIFTGKMDYRPNVDAVLWFVQAVLPLVLASAPDAHFYVVGQKPHARLAALADHPAVTITGRVPDVRPYIAGAGVYVVPLRIGGGTRLKVLEAMAMGQAIVSTRLGCDGFLFEDGREVAFADDPSTFAMRVVTLLKDSVQATALGQRARAYVEAHFGWDAIVPRLEAVYP